MKQQRWRTAVIVLLSTIAVLAVGVLFAGWMVVQLFQR